MCSAVDKTGTLALFALFAYFWTRFVLSGLRAHTALLVLAVSTPLVTWAAVSLFASEPTAKGAWSQWGGALLLGGIMALSNTVNKVVFIALGTYFNQISDGAAGGTIVTLLNSLSNLGRFSPRVPAFWLAGLTNPLVVAAGVALLGFVQLPAVSRWIGELQRTSAEDWHLEAAAAVSVPLLTKPERAV